MLTGVMLTGYDADVVCCRRGVMLTGNDAGMRCDPDGV